MRDHAGGARLVVEHGAHEDDLAHRLPARRTPVDGDGLPFFHLLKIGGWHRKLDPDPGQIGDDVKLSLLAFLSDRRAKIDPAFDDAA